MQYFIPAWYKGNDWKENEQVWYKARTVTEFDDTVKQIQLFFRKHVSPFKMLLLGFSPNFRHFLHRQGVYHAPYISCFDAMQGIKTDTMQMFSFHDLTWPEDVEFIYSPFAVIVRRGGEKYAQIEFAEDGNVFRVDLFEKELMVCSNFYDDRGFMSCQLKYQLGVPYREQYFNEEGVWKFARFLDDGHVLINPDSSWYLMKIREDECRADYRRLRYDSIDEVIEEVLQAFMNEMAEEDGIIAALHSLHSEILCRTLQDRNLILSLFERRLMAQPLTEADKRLINRANYIVADRQATADVVGRYIGNKKPMRVITPYDSRIEFGTSQHLHVQSVLVAVDKLADDQFDALVVMLTEYILNQNSRARIALFTRSALYNEKMNILQRAAGALRKAGINPDYAGYSGGVSENSLDTMEKVDAIFTVAQCVDEMSVSRTLREQRVLVDLQSVPDQFLQISAMSMGIPQITMIENDYIEDGKNGIVLGGIASAAEAVDYYLSSIEHFNQAQIASYDLGSKFATGKLVDAWKEVMESHEHQSTSAGKN